MARLPSETELADAQQRMDAYHLALGRVANSWNHMQEQLGLLFCAVAGLDQSMGMGIWQALKSDRNQRDLLEAAIATASSDEEWQRTFPKAKDDIAWILTKVQKQSEGRNNAIHAPVFARYGADASVRPMTFHGNPNAAKLAGKDILAQLEWYQEYFEGIRDFAADIYLTLKRIPFPKPSGQTWPERPLLPTVQQKSGRQDHSHQDGPK